MALSFGGLVCYWSCTFLSTWGQRVHFISSAYGRNHDSHHFWSLCVLVLDERVQWISHQCCRKSEIYIFLAYVTFTILIFFWKKKKFSLLVGQTLIPVPLSLCLYRVSVESAQCCVGFYAWNCQVGTVTTVHITHTLTHTGAGPF